MLPIKLFRESPDVIREDLKKRGSLEELNHVDDVITLDTKNRTIQFELDKLRHEKNELSLEFNKLKKAGEDTDDVLKKVKELPERVKKLEEEKTVIEGKIRTLLMKLPNILHSSVPVGKDGTENVTVKTWGVPRKTDFDIKLHSKIAEDIGGADFERAVKIAGSGQYFLTGTLAELDLALQRFALDQLLKKGYQLVIPPHMMNRQAYEGVTALGEFETVMYKIQDHDEYLIATSEHPLTARFMNEVIPAKSLPMKFIGISPCYRREVGSHGLDTRGLFRVHQFTKIEQIIICKPEDSWKFHEELQQNAEEIFQALKLPFRVVNICTGDIGIVAAKKYDIEAWMPRENDWKEVTSCSNCTAYQSVRLNIRYEQDNKREHVHTLNATAIATARALRAILENYQEKDGSVTIPAVLQPYMGGRKKL